MNDDEINIKLSQNEAWVLFDFVRRFSNEEKLEIHDQAEERALWNLCCIFEKQLSMGSNELSYENFIEQHRSELRDKK